MDMVFESLRLRNYRGFEDSGDICLSPGLNVIVGRNNVGKTSIVEALHLVGYNDSNYSRGENPTIERCARNNALSAEVEVGFRILRSDPRFTVKIDDSPSELSHVRIKLVQRSGGSLFELKRLDIKRLGEDTWEPALDIKVDNTNFRSLIRGLSFPLGIGNLLNPILERLTSKSFYLRPHRVTPETAALATQTRLDSTASNFHQVTHTVFSNSPEIWREVEQFVLGVLDDVESVLTKVLPGNQTALHLRLKGSGVDVPLSDCGTGVEQLLVVAFLVISSRVPLTLLWDEPHAFLHPSAERALISLMKRYSEHQYIISTHSPVFINAVEPSGLVLVTRAQQRSVAQNIVDRTKESALIFKELGSTNADMFLSERIVFVEGPSDGPIYRTLLEKLGYDCTGTVFAELGGDGKIASAKQRHAVIKSYERLLEKVSVLPIGTRFVLDLSDEYRQEDLKRSYGDKVQFLPRGEIESYLLDPDAIAKVITEKAQHYEVDLPEDFSSSWVAKKLSEEDDKASAVLESIFGKLSLYYEKTKDGPALARLTHLENQTMTVELDKIFAGFIPKTQ